MRATFRQPKAKRKPSDISDTVAQRSVHQYSERSGKGKALSGKAGRSRDSKTQENRLNVDHYAFRIFWSAENRQHVGACAEFPSLSHLDASPAKALKGIRDLIESVILELNESGAEVPSPISERPYSGAFKVRVPPLLHRRLVMEAAEQGVSLNRLVSAKLAV